MLVSPRYQQYGELVLVPGSSPFVSPIRGVDVGSRRLSVSTIRGVDVGSWRLSRAQRHGKLIICCSVPGMDPASGAFLPLYPGCGMKKNTGSSITIPDLISKCLQIKIC
jgi:hypothetical protein